MTVHCALLFLRWTSETAVVYTESAQRRGVAFTHSVTLRSGQVDGTAITPLPRYVLTSAALGALRLDTTAEQRSLEARSTCFRVPARRRPPR